MFKDYLKKRWLGLLIASLMGASLMAGLIVYTIFTGGLGLVTLPYVGAFISTVMSQFSSFGLAIQIVSAVGVSLATGLMAGLLTLSAGLGITGIRQNKLKKEAALKAKQTDSEQKKDATIKPGEVVKSEEAKSADNVSPKKMSVIKRWFYEKVVAKFSPNNFKQLATANIDFAAKLFAKPDKLRKELAPSEQIDVLNSLIIDENSFTAFQQKLKNYYVEDISAIFFKLMSNPIFLNKPFNKPILHGFIDNIKFNDHQILSLLITKNNDGTDDLRKELINKITQIVGVEDIFILLDKLNNPMLVFNFLTDLAGNDAGVRTSGKDNWLQPWLINATLDANAQVSLKNLLKEPDVIAFFDAFSNSENKLLIFIKLLNKAQYSLDELSYREKILDVIILYKSLLAELSDERKCEIIFAEDYNLSDRANKKTIEMILKSINTEKITQTFLERISINKLNQMFNIFKENAGVLLPLLIFLQRKNSQNSLDELCKENSAIFDLVFSYPILVDKLTEQYQQEVIFSADNTFLIPKHNEIIKKTLHKLEDKQVPDYLKPYLTIDKTKTLFTVFQNNPDVLKLLLNLLANNLLEKDKTLDNLCETYPKIKDLVFSHNLLAQALSYDYRVKVLASCNRNFITDHREVILHIITSSASEMIEFIKNTHGKTYLKQMDALQFAAIGSELKKVDAMYYNDLAENTDYQEICNVFHNKLYSEAKESKEVRDKVVQDPNANFYFLDKELKILKGLHKDVSFKHAYSGEIDHESFEIACDDYKEALEYLAKKNNLPNYKSDFPGEIDKANKVIKVILSHAALIQADFYKNDILNKNLKLGQFALMKLDIAENIINNEMLNELLDIFELVKIKEKYCKHQALEAKEKNAFSYFNLTERSDFEDFKRQFIDLSIQYHPDKGGDIEKFKELNDLHEIAVSVFSQRKKTMELENKINILINDYLQINIPNWNNESQANREKGKKLLSDISRYATYKDKDYFSSAFKLINDKAPIPLGKLALMDYSFAKSIIDNDCLIEYVDTDELNMLKKYDYSNKLNKGNLEFFKLTEHSASVDLDNSFKTWLLQKLIEFKKEVNIDKFLEKVKNRVELKDAAINVINSINNDSKIDDFEVEDLKQTYDELLKLSTFANYKPEKIKKESEKYADVKKAYETIKTVFDFNEKLMARIEEKKSPSIQSNNKVTFRRH